ncbi:MAG: DUF423 domain-containing protein [Pseudomonadota bacterium]
MSLWLAAGAVNGFLAVALGAFAAHGLKDRLDAQALGWVETGVQYQMFHTLALLAVAWLASREDVQGWSLQLAGWGFLAGCVLFSGLLYLMALTGTRGLGVVVPLGGLAFLAGWVGLLVTALRV